MKKSYDSKFKSRVALEALRGERSIAEISGEYNIHPNLVAQWKKKLQKSSADVFATKAERQQQFDESYLLNLYSFQNSIRI